jgi:K+-sensing histidine kinase KdpD
VLRNVVAGHQRRNPERQVVLTGDSPLYVNADSMGVELALANLLNNAEKYAPPASRIEVASHQEGNRVTVLVINEGVSLPQDRYRRLWDIYTHGPDPDIAVSGSGIGLALCKELVEMMGGRVWAGPREHGGSIFAVTLPAAEEENRPVQEGATVIELTARTA